ncbi:MAG TPA: trans-aconitate 2-methyltransferase [Polyangia bacterium]|nr:trans-aconitate 2-methyltransferase [Polyangia bacterium]
MAWNPEQYLKFGQPRLRPALDLLARVPLDAPRAVCDLGCGAGNVTRLLAERWPAAAVTGVDDSPDMLAHAARALPSARWVRANIADWEPAEACELIFSNAALQWLPAHEALFPRLLAQLAPGGVLAVQMPRNFAAPSHTAVAETIAAGPWRAALEPLIRAQPVATPAAYHDWLAPSTASVDIWESEYLHVLTGADPVKEWTKGTYLRPFLDALPDDGARAAFEAAYAARVAAAYPARPDGTTLFPFRRLFIVAVARA